MNIRLLSNAPHPAGNGTERWDGRKDDGTFHQGSFTIFFGIPATLPQNVIIVSGGTELTDFHAEAYLILPVFGEVSLLRYTLPASSSVTVTLTDPNGNLVRTLLNGTAQSAGLQSIEWNGKNDAGLIVSTEGSYKVTLTALESGTGQTRTRQGSVVVYK
jgi:hypothetical protein